MRTSEEIYHRVRWDPRFDPARFVMGVNARDAPPKRVPLAAFVPGGDIPWHRVLFVEADGELVWDRATGVDRIDDSAAGRVRAPRRLRPPFFAACTPHVWSPSAGWAPASAVSEVVGPTSARVLTWNTLWDRYDSDRIDTARRHPLLLAALERADADVIALQEVERALLDHLLAAPWVRAAYTIGTDPGGHDVDDSGVLLLSRLPVREAGRHAFGPYKAVAAITVGDLVVAAVHLSSDHSQDGAGRRAAELDRLHDGLSGVDGRLVVVGDFNDGTDTPSRVLSLRDAWTETHGDGTATFDPVANPLAAVSSLTGRAARLDRVLLRRGDLRVTAAVLVGDEPVDGRFPSDHYGVQVDLTVEALPVDAVDLPPTARTALAWIPPSALWPAIQEVRREHDPQIDRWPPHVNILFGFLPEWAFDEAAVQVSAVAAAFPPFEARLAGVRSFRHRDDTTVWLDPAAADPKPWASLRAALERRFPRCAGRAEGYTPHLTLGRGPLPRSVGIPPATATVDELVLLSRRGDEPMRPRAVVTLGTGEIRWLAPLPLPPNPDPSEVVDHAVDSTVDSIEDIFAKAAQPGPAGAPATVPPALHLVGSRRVGCALPGADLDLVVALPGEVDLDDVQARLTAALPGISAVRPVIGARVPGLRLAVGALPVDLVIVGTGAVPPTEAVARRAEFGEAAATSLSAVTDAEAILAAVGDVASFPALARSVKGWARARGLDSAPFGGLPGLAWTVLAARTALDARELPPAELLEHFFGSWAAWDWRQPVALTGPAPGGEDPLTILTPSHPIRSCTTQVSPGFAELLTQELYQAWEGDEPVPMHRRHAAWAVLTVEATPGSDLDVTVGRVRGRVRALLADLEYAGAADAHAWPRPFETGPTRRRYAIGLGRDPITASALARATAGWVRALPGVRVDHLDAAAVPTLR